MESGEQTKTLKRRRSDSDDVDEDELSGDHSIAWNDPTLLEEMGVGILASDESDDVQDELAVLACPSPDSDDFSENVDVKKGCNEMFREKKKRKLNDHREPLKEQQLLVKSKTERTDDVKLEKLKPADCVIKNSQVIYDKEKHNNIETERDRNNSSIHDNTDNICKHEFKVSKVLVKENAAGSDVDYFSQLPEELILEIFKKLDRKSVVRCCLVSRLFNRVACDETLWERVDLGARTLQPEALSYVMRRGPFVVRLASACILEPIFRPRFLPKNFVSKIVFLDLSMASISAEGLAVFLKYCTQLKKLSVENCVVNNEVASAIGGNRGLEVLNMAMCTGLLDAGLTSIFTCCNRLQSVNMAWTNLSTQAIDVLACKIPASVERLNISGCRRNISDQHVVDLLERCTNLLELDVSDCIDLTERTIEYIVEHVTGLEYLAISRCYSIPLECLPTLKKVNSLTFLDLFGLCTDRELKQLKFALDTITLNQFMFSSVARPTVGLRRTSIWGLRVRD